MPGTSRKFMDETFLNREEENLLARQWQCEYIYSDLSFTSVLPEAKKTRSTVSMFRHGAHRRLRATVLSMCCVTYGISGVAGLAASRSKFVFYTCRPDAYTINIAPDGSVLSENPKDGNLRCTDMLTRSVVHDGIFYVLKRAVVISHNGLYG